jgi:acetyl esterase/lipase
MFILRILLGIFVLTHCTISALFAQDTALNQREVIYGRKDGMALTMIVATPKGKSNGKSIIQVISSGYISDMRYWNEQQAKLFVANGYVVFAVAHGSQPRYTLPDAIGDIQRAVRFIKYHASEYGIDSGKIGITGSSSGANLALLAGLMDGTGDPKSDDPVDHLSGKANAVACWAPPTDLLDWRWMGDNVLNSGIFEKYPYFNPAVDFKHQDTISFKFVSITDTVVRNQILKNLSPVNYVSNDDPPVLTLHGDKDETVPIRQSEILIAALKQVGVTGRLVIAPGADHRSIPPNANQAYADWFNQYLK